MFLREEGQWVFRLVLVNEMALCYLQPLVKRWMSVCVCVCKCTCMYTYIYMQVYVTFCPCTCVFYVTWYVQHICICACVGAQKFPSHYACFTVAQPFIGRSLWYVFRAISEQIYWLIIEKQVHRKWGNIWTVHQGHTLCRQCLKDNN